MNFILRRLKSDFGAFDKILVTLLFIVIAVAALVATVTWYDGQQEVLINEASTQVQNALN